MVRTNKCDLREDENLAIEVEKHPCLYNKGCKEYKERDRCKNAWKEIEKQLGLEQGIILLFWYTCFICYWHFVQGVSKMGIILLFWYTCFICYWHFVQGVSKMEKTGDHLFGGETFLRFSVVL